MDLLEKALKIKPDYAEAWGYPGFVDRSIGVTP
jgi:hypothetical protein